MAWEAGDGPGHTLGSSGWDGFAGKECSRRRAFGANVPQAWGCSNWRRGLRGPQGGGGTALAGWAGACAQLVGVMGVFAVVGVQVLAKAECSRPVTLAGLLLAGSSAGCGDKASQGPEAPGPHSHPCSLEAHSHGDVMSQGWVRARADTGGLPAGPSSPSSLLCPPLPSHPLPPCSWSANSSAGAGGGAGRGRAGAKGGFLGRSCPCEVLLTVECSHPSSREENDE